MPDSRVIPRRRKRAKRYRFHPPRHVRAWMAFARWLAPRYLRWVLKVERVEIPPADRARLEELRSERVVLAPNHPTQDPAVMFQLSTLLNMQYYWLAARELFETRFEGFIVSRLGAYSIDRGAHDADSVHMTRRLLREGRHWLVLFPEGVNHFLHDVVMPFLPGAARLGFGALSDLAEQGASPPLYLVPVALRYHYTADMRPQMDSALRRLERYLRLEIAPVGRGWLMRMGRIAERAMAANEDYYGVVPQPQEDLATRLDRLREVVLRRVADSLGVETPPVDKPLRNRVRSLMNAANRVMQHKPLSASEYEREMNDRRVRTAARQYRELRRVMEFVAVTPEIESDLMTVENYLDVLGRLETEILGKWRCWGPRQVTVRAGEPLDLRARLDEFRSDPDEASEAAMLELEQRVRGLLDSTAHLMSPLPAP